MKKCLFLLALPLLMSSCATLLAKKEHTLRLYSNRPNVRAVVNDSTYDLPARVLVARSKKDLAVKLITDSVTKDYTIKSMPNQYFLYGNLAYIYACPVAYLVDFNSQKRFYYGFRAHLNDNDTITTIAPSLEMEIFKAVTKAAATSKGDINFTGSLLYGSLFFMKPRNEPKENIIGALGLGAGLEYYYRNHKYLRANASYSFGVEPFEAFGAYTTVSGANFTLTDNYNFNRFSFGYGFNFGVYRWELNNPDYEFPPSQQYAGNYESLQDMRPQMRKDSHAFGASINIYCRIVKSLWAGVVYNPTFYTVFPSAAQQYQHIVSFEMVWKINLRRDKQWQILRGK